VKKILSAAVILASLAGGCAVHSGPPMTLTREQFATLYDDEQKFNFVWYMGSDASYHYFCMEHWILKPDGSDLDHRDNRKFYQVELAELGVKRPFPRTNNENQWRLLRPHIGDNPTP
jgi:hypothetical protein